MTLLIYASVAGIIGIIGGIIAWVKAETLSKVATGSARYLWPTLKEDEFRRRNLLFVRVIAAFWIACGVGVIAYHLIRAT